jgi:hypothetical protein
MNLVGSDAYAVLEFLKLQCETHKWNNVTVSAADNDADV